MVTYQHEFLSVARGGVSRRGFLRTAAAGTLSLSGLCGLHAEELKKQGRAMILLYMQGGPSQFETFDPKPHHENGGGTKVIATAVPGIQIAEPWKEMAKVMGDCALLRSLTNKEGNHQRASYQLHTGYLPSGSVKHPAFGCAVAQQMGVHDADLPCVVSIGRTEGAGFLGVDYEPFVVDKPGELPRNVAVPVADARLTRRVGLLGKLEQEFAVRGAQQVVENHGRLYGKASRMVLSPQISAFDFTDEPAEVKARYGDSQFGRGCLLARRLVEHGVPFIEVRMNGWDTHQDNFEKVPELAAQVDPAMAALISELKERGLLERTTVLWAGEFGRTPKVNPRDGRDHYPRAFNGLMAGGGIRGGQAIGRSSDDGTSIADRPVTVADLFTSICKTLQIDPRHENISPIGRPMKIVDGGEVVSELFA
jgi:hypothetical protein